MDGKKTHKTRKEEIIKENKKKARKIKTDERKGLRNVSETDGRQMKED